MSFLDMVNIYPVMTRIFYKTGLYNRQLHQSEKAKLRHAANAIAGAATGGAELAASGAGDVGAITGPVTSNGTANAVTARQLAADLTIA
jgi:hypothetical protein